MGSLSLSAQSKSTSSVKRSSTSHYAAVGTLSGPRLHSLEEQILHSSNVVDTQCSSPSCPHYNHRTKSGRGVLPARDRKKLRRSSPLCLGRPLNTEAPRRKRMSMFARNPQKTGLLSPPGPS